MKILEEFKTTDIILAACLKINGHSMTSIERVGNKGTFIFKDIPEEFITEFDLGNVKVEPVMFNQAIKTLTTAVRRMSH